MTRWGQEGLILKLQLGHGVMHGVVVAIMCHMKLTKSPWTLNET